MKINTLNILRIVCLFLFAQFSYSQEETPNRYEYIPSVAKRIEDESHLIAFAYFPTSFPNGADLNFRISFIPSYFQTPGRLTANTTNLHKFIDFDALEEYAETKFMDMIWVRYVQLQKLHFEGENIEDIQIAPIEEFVNRLRKYRSN